MKNFGHQQVSFYVVGNCEGHFHGPVASRVAAEYSFEGGLNSRDFGVAERYEVMDGHVGPLRRGEMKSSGSGHRACAVLQGFAHREERKQNKETGPYHGRMITKGGCRPVTSPARGVSQRGVVETLCIPF